MKQNKTETKNVKVAKMVEFIKTCNQYPHKFNFCHFFSSIILPLSVGKPWLEEMGNFFLPGGEFCLGAYLPIILTPET